MNCACNRYKTCTECRTAYKESVKRERRASDMVAELEQMKDNQLLNMDFVTYNRIYKLIQNGVKKE